MSMQFTDICFITKDVLRLCAFYEAVLGGKAEGDEVHSVFSQAGINFTFMLEKTETFYFDMGSGGSNTVLTFEVDDVDAEYERMLLLKTEIVHEPKTHPWGARSFQFKDPDGNILNFRSL